MKTICGISGRRLLTFSLLVGLFSACADNNGRDSDLAKGNINVSKMGGTVRLIGAEAPGDTLDYSLTLTNFGSGATGAQFTVTASGSGWQRPIRQATTTLTTPFKLINTTAWTTSTFKLYAWGTRGAVISKDSTLIATWTVNRSVGPPSGGTIDSSLVISIREFLNPEHLSAIQPVTVHLYTSDTTLTCPGEWVGAGNRGLRILPTFQTNVTCVVRFKEFHINTDALRADSLAKLDTDSIYKQGPPVPWPGTVTLLTDIDSPPTLLSEGIKHDSITIEVGQSFQMCYIWRYNDGTDYDTCLPGRTVLDS